MVRFSKYKLYTSAATFLLFNIALASQANLDEKLIICPAENAIASDSEMEHGWPPKATIFWFDDGRVTQLEDDSVKDTSLPSVSKSTNYYSNDKELWFDLGYTYSIDLQTLQLFRVISMGGETELRNKKCSLQAGD